jgi:hypothetical protein
MPYLPRLWRCVAVGFAVLAVACDNIEPPTASSMRATPPTLSLAAAPRGRFWTLDDEQARIAREEIPGYAGYYSDKEGNLTLLLRDTATSATAETVFNGYVKKWYGNRADHLHVKHHRKVAFDFNQLKEWHDSLMWRFANRGLTYSDVNEVDNKVWLGAASAGVLQSIHAAMKELRIPERAVRVEISQPDQVLLCVEGDPDCPPPPPPPPPPPDDFSVGSDAPPNGLSNHQATFVGGLDINFNHDPALGGSRGHCTEVGPGTYLSTIKGFLTAAHCTYDEGIFESHNGDNDYVQGTDDNTIIAKSRTSMQYYPFGQLSGCPSSNGCRLSDALIAEFTGFPGTAHYIPSLTYFGFQSSTYIASLLGLHIVTSRQSNTSQTIPAPQGTYVEKMGIATGWTGGTVSETCYNSFRGTHGLMCQEVVTSMNNSSMIRHGDSGGPVFSYFPYTSSHSNGSDVQLEGIAVATKGFDEGFMVYSPMWNIRQEFSGGPNISDVCFWEGC